MIILRYLFRELMRTMVAITLVLMVIFITNQFVHYLRDAANGLITMMAVVKMMALQIPLLMGFLVPLGFYLSVFITYGRLFQDHEMTILFASGVSRLRLLYKTLGIALFVSLMVAVLMVYFDPMVQSLRTHILNEAITKASIQKVVAKRFQHIDQNTIFYAKSLSRQHQSMKQILLVHQPDKTHPEWSIVLAHHARQINEVISGKHYILFEKGNRYLIGPKQLNVQHLAFGEYGIHLAHSKTNIHDWPNSVATGELWRLMDHLKGRPQHQVAGLFHWRIAMPISVLLFALIAFPLCQVNPRSGKFARILPALILYIIYANCIFMGRAWIESGAINPYLGLWWVHGLFLTVGLVLNFYQFVWKKDHVA